MVPVKYRIASKKDFSELQDLYYSVIHHTLSLESYELHYLSEKYSDKWIEETLSSEKAYFVVVLYMGIIVAAVKIESNFLSGIAISKHYQNQGLENDIWEFACAYLATREIVEPPKAEFLHEFSRNISTTKLAKKKPIDLNYPHLFEYVLGQAYKPNELPKAKKLVREQQSTTQAIKRVLKQALIYALLLSFFFLDGYKVLFSPDKALEAAAFGTLEQGYVQYGQSRANENYSEWKIDLLLWRGAKPIYQGEDYDCAGAFSVAYMWYNPKLIRHLTKKMNIAEKEELIKRCKGIIESYPQEKQARLIADLNI